MKLIVKLLRRFGRRESPADLVGWWREADTAPFADRTLLEVTADGSVRHVDERGETIAAGSLHDVAVAVRRGRLVRA